MSNMSNVMYAITDKYNEDFYWNFVEDDFLMTIDTGSLLPTMELATDYIEDQLGSDCVVAKVTIYQITRDGTWEYSVELDYVGKNVLSKN